MLKEIYISMVHYSKGFSHQKFEIFEKEFFITAHVHGQEEVVKIIFFFIL